RQTERERDALKAELAALKAGTTLPAAAPAAPAPVVAATEAEPDPATYPGGEYDPKYLRDLTAYEAQKAVRLADQQRTHQARIDAVTSKGEQAHPDFRASILAAYESGLRFTPVLNDIILTHDLGHEFAYYLATHPEDFRRLASQPNPVAAALDA